MVSRPNALSHECPTGRHPRAQSAASPSARQSRRQHARRLAPRRPAAGSGQPPAGAAGGSASHR
eukprot:3342016-Alexandrium_andersonii.AAC.1